MRTLRWIVVAAVLACGARAHAAVPGTITGQGRLLNLDGTAASGTVSFTFAIYAAATGGSALWTETVPVLLDDGYFVVELGSMTAFPAGLWDGQVKFLGVKVESDSEMTPRQTVASVPYALQAGDAFDAHGRTLTVNNIPIVSASGTLLVGSVGPTGAAGAVGPTGPRGSTGAAGATGPRGVTGSVGAGGLSGIGGAAGPAGIAGLSGPTGAVGPQGVTGGVGSTGGVGATGPQGAAGPNGPTVFFKMSTAPGSVLMPGAVTTFETLTATFPGPGDVVLTGSGSCRTNTNTVPGGAGVIIEVGTSATSAAGNVTNAHLTFAANQNVSWRPFMTMNQFSVPSGTNNFFMNEGPFGAAPSGSILCVGNLAVEWAPSSLLP